MLCFTVWRGRLTSDQQILDQWYARKAKGGDKSTNDSHIESDGKRDGESLI